MLVVTDIFGNTEAVSGYKGLKRYRNTSGERTLSFLLFPTEQNVHSFDLVAEESLISFGGEEYRVKQLKEKPRGRGRIKEVVAVRKMFDLINSYKYEVHNGSLTFEAALQFVLGGTGYTWSIVDSFLAKDWENFGDDNRIALFQDTLNRYGPEFTLRDRHFTFKNKIGNATDFQFRYNYNIKTISRSVNTNNLSTYIKGFGKDGLELEYISPNADTFINPDSPDGYYHAKPVRDERYSTQEGLLQRMKAEIKDKPELSITIDFADMRRQGFPYDVPNEGDEVFLIYEPLNLDVEARIMEIEEEFVEGQEYPIKTNVTLANFKKSVIKTLVNFKQTQKQVDNIFDGSAKLPYNVLDEAVRIATEALQSAQTELIFENGITGVDKDNPNYLTRFTSRGIGVSSDGGNTFPDAIVKGQINTSLLAAGQIKTNNIQIIGNDDLFYWDGNHLIAMDPNDINKFVRIKSGEIYIAKGASIIERPDGYKVIDNGILNHEFNIQGAMPEFRSPYVTTEARFLVTSKATEEDCQYYSFRHDSRFLKITVGMYAGHSLHGSRMTIVGVGDGIILAQKVTYDTSPTSNLAVHGETLTIDLGPPTGQPKGFYVRLNSGIDGSKAYGRVISIWKEG